MLVYKHVCEGPRVMSGIFLDYSTLLIEAGSVGQTQSPLVRLLSIAGDSLSKPSQAGITDMLPCIPGISVDAAYLNSHSLVYVCSKRFNH